MSYLGGCYSHAMAEKVRADQIVQSVFTTRYNWTLGKDYSRVELDLWSNWLLCNFFDINTITALNALVAEIKKSMPPNQGGQGRDPVVPPNQDPFAPDPERKTAKETLADITDFLGKNKTLLLIIGALGLGYMWVSQKGKGGLPQIIMMGKQRKRRK